MGITNRYNNTAVLSIVKRLFPQMVAHSNVSERSTKQRLQSKEEPFNIYPYIAQRHDSLWDLGFAGQDMNDMINWCTNTFVSGTWHYHTGSFYFRNENDRTMFMMRWM